MYAPLIINSSSQNTKGVGMYMSSNWVTPQRYQSPFGGAKVEVPAGWGTGLSGCGCGGKCGGCGDHGLGDVFSSGLDVSQWGIGEWSVIGLGTIIAAKLFTGGKKAAGVYKKHKRRSQRRAKLAQELRSI